MHPAASQESSLLRFSSGPAAAAALHQLLDAGRMVSGELAVISANWRAPSGQRWNFPLGGRIGKSFKIEGQPLNAQFQAFDLWRIRPSAGAGPSASSCSFCSGAKISTESRPTRKLPNLHRILDQSWRLVLRGVCPERETACL